MSRLLELLPIFRDFFKMNNVYINQLSIPCKYLPGFYIHPDYPMYSVDCNGNVYSYYKRRLLKCSPDNKGYKRFSHYTSTYGKITIKIHRLVAFHFVPLPPEFGGDYSKATVDHVDGNKLNNHYTNLEWVTTEENSARAWRNGLCNNQCRPIVIIDKETKQIMKFPSISEAERLLLLTQGLIGGYLSRNRSGYVAGKYICGYQDDQEFISKLDNIEKLIEDTDASLLAKPIVVLNKDTKEISYFSSIAEAERILGLNKSMIGKYLSINRSGYVAGKYICGYQDDQEFISKLKDIDDMIKAADANTLMTAIVVLDKVTKEFKFYSSIISAEKDINVKEGTIRGYLAHNRKGYVADRYICGYRNDITFMSKLSNIDKMIKEADENTNKAVILLCYDNHNKTIMEYPSIANCAKQLGLSIAGISYHLIKGSITPIRNRFTITRKE